MLERASSAMPRRKETGVSCRTPPGSTMRCSMSSSRWRSGHRVLAVGAGPRVGDAAHGAVLEQQRDLGGQRLAAGPDDRLRRPATRRGDQAGHLQRLVGASLVESAGQQPHVHLGGLQRRQPRGQRAAVIGGGGLDHRSSRPTRPPVARHRRRAPTRPPPAPTCPGRRGVWQAMRGTPRSRSAMRSATRRSATGARRPASAARSSSSPQPVGCAAWLTMRQRPRLRATDRRLGPGRSDVDQQRHLGPDRRVARSRPALVDGHRAIPSQSPSRNCEAVDQQRQAADQEEVRASRRSRPAAASDRSRPPPPSAARAARRAGSPPAPAR